MRHFQRNRLCDFVQDGTPQPRIECGFVDAPDNAFEFVHP